MHIPSERVYREMISEPSSLWFVPASGGEHAILLKAPSNVLKGVFNKCRIEINFSVKVLNNKRLLSYGVKIHDDEESPFINTGSIRVQEEHKAIHEILLAQSTPFFLFDEVDRCVAWCDVSFEKEKAANLLKLLDHQNGFFSGPFDSDFSYALDCHDLSLELPVKNEKAEKVPTFSISMHLTDFNRIKLHTVGDNEAHEFGINDDNEGFGLEQSAWHILQWKFKEQIFRSPSFSDGRVWKELTDILGISDYGVFLIETKAMSVINSPDTRSMERKAKGLIKQVKKGINQLKGAIATIRAENEIYGQTYANSSIKIDVPRNIPPHAIVLVSELLPFGDWDAIVEEIMKASCAAKAYFHVFDMRELALLAKVTADLNMLDYNLVTRFENFVKSRTIFIRGQVPPREQTST
jgi:hypothetical protein